LERGSFGCPFFLPRATGHVLAAPLVPWYLLERAYIRVLSMRCFVSSENEAVVPAADLELDLRGVICPYNFVKTKLKLETMKTGQVLSVLLDDGDPIKNVPMSVQNEGHTVLGQERIDQSFRVLIRCENSD
jgi:tRNA 2-thiouridine synthesizing protein A